MFVSFVFRNELIYHSAEGADKVIIVPCAMCQNPSLQVPCDPGAPETGVVVKNAGCAHRSDNLAVEEFWYSC